MLKKDEELASQIVNRIIREKKSQPLQKWGPSWRNVWIEAIADELKRFRNDQKKSDPQTETIFNAYPRRIAKAPALVAIKKAVREVGYSELLAKTEEYAKAVGGWSREYRNSGTAGRDIVPHPATWFNRASYHDDPSEWVGDAGYGRSRSSGTGKVAPSGWVSVFLGVYGREEYSLYPGGGIRRLRDGAVLTWSDLTEAQKEKIINNA